MTEIKQPMISKEEIKWDINGNTQSRKVITVQGDNLKDCKECFDLLWRD